MKEFIKDIVEDMPSLPAATLGTPEHNCIGPEDRQGNIDFLNEAANMNKAVGIESTPEQRHAELMEVMRAHNWPAPMPKVTPTQ